MSATNNKYALLMLVVLLLAFALGARGLNLDILWSDEIYSLVFMGAYHPPPGPADPAQVVAIVQELAPDHVSLFYVIAAVWAQLTGWAQVPLRYLSLLAGVLMIACLYRFVAEALDRRTAATAALMMATSAFVVVYFHELRAYTFIMAIAIFHCWIYWRLLYLRSTSRLAWITLVLTASVLLYTHNLNLVLFAALGISHLVHAPRSRAWNRILAAWALGLLTFIPYLPSLISGDFAFGSNTRALSTLELANAWSTVLVNGYVVFWLPLLLAFAYAIRRERKRAVIHIGLIAIVMCLCMFVANWRFSIIPVTRIRYFLVVWWLFIILFSYGLTALPRWRIWTLAFIALWSVAGFFFGRSERMLEYTGFISFARTYPPLHRYADELQGRVKDADFVIGFTEENWVNHDGDLRHGFSTTGYYFGLLLGIDGEFLDVGSRAWEIERDLQFILADHPEVLLVYDPGQYQEQVELATSTIQDRYPPCPSIVEKPDLVIRRFAHPLIGCGHESRSIAYENGVQVVDYAASLDAESERVEALIRWQAPDAAVLDIYNVSLQVVTPEWENVRQIDRHLRDGLTPWSVLELSTAGLKRGDYRLMLVLYDRHTGERVAGVDVFSRDSASILPLLAFSVHA